MKQDMQVLTSSQEQDWITPSEVIDKIRLVLGEIDLDPASSLTANTIIKANKILTAEDNIFENDLKCKNLYMNPPFGKIKNKSQAGIFTDYVLNQYKLGHIEEGGIILIMTRLGYNWFETYMDMMVSATLKKRVKFINAKTLKQGAQAKTTQTLFCFGDYVEKFEEVFADDARIYKPKNRLI